MIENSISLNHGLMVPKVSVVMGVYNAESSLAAAVHSILSQTFTDLEVIVVNDGSTDASRKILADIQRVDDRLQIIDQENQGLTRSLIRGCAAARGRFIARQDADDVSLPDRLQRQVAALTSSSDAVLATSWVEDVSPEGISCAVYRDLKHSVYQKSGIRHELTGIAAHGSVMMRREALMAAGGYRASFYYAQDSDLWLRLSEQGTFVVVPEILYRRVVGTGTISSRFRLAQSRFCELAQDSFRALKAGESDEEFLAEAERLADQCRASRGVPIAAHEEATSLLLLASQLFDKHPTLARKYLWQAIRICPFHLRSWKALLVSYAELILAFACRKSNKPSD